MWSLGCVIAELFLGWPLYPGALEYDQVIILPSDIFPDINALRQGDGEFLNVMCVCWRGQNKQQEMNCPRFIWRLSLLGISLPGSPNTQHVRYARSFICRCSLIYVFCSDLSAANPA